MPSEQPFKRLRFPAAIILCAVRMYLRYPLSYQEVADLLAERGVDVDRSTGFRWVQNFGPELSKRAGKLLSRASLNWHVDETYLRVGIPSHRCRQQLPGSEWRYPTARQAIASQSAERVGAQLMQMDG